MGDDLFEVGGEVLVDGFVFAVGVGERGGGEGEGPEEEGEAEEHQGFEETHGYDEHGEGDETAQEIERFIRVLAVVHVLVWYDKGGYEH